MIKKQEIKKYIVAHESSEIDMSSGELIATTGGGWWILLFEKQFCSRNEESHARLIADALNAASRNVSKS